MRVVVAFRVAFFIPILGRAARGNQGGDTTMPSRSIRPLPESVALTVARFIGPTDVLPTDDVNEGC
jgi:hypothetical protein